MNTRIHLQNIVEELKKANIDVNQLNITSFLNQSLLQDGTAFAVLLNRTHSMQFPAQSLGHVLSLSGEERLDEIFEEYE